MYLPDDLCVILEVMRENMHTIYLETGDAMFLGARIAIGDICRAINFGSEPVLIGDTL